LGVQVEKANAEPAVPFIMNIGRAATGLLVAFKTFKLFNRVPFDLPHGREVLEWRSVQTA
jgi:hypothetical protein